jgi:hypothetical protein
VHRPFHFHSGTVSFSQRPASTVPTSLLQAAALPSVFTLGKEPFALGTGFAKCSTRNSPIGNIFHGKGTLPSAFYYGTWQIIKNFAECLERHSAKFFPAATAPAVKGYFAECPTQHSAKKN